MANCLKRFDIFASEPNLLTFGDPANPKTREMWKTSWGGCSSICFLMLVSAYIGYSAYAVSTGDKDIIEILSEPTSPIENMQLTLEGMRVLPVVHFDYLASSVYLDTQHHAFKKNIFVAMQ